MSEDDSGPSTFRKVLIMVGELHRRGFQLIRAFPMMSPSGMYWRCNVAPALLASPNHGALLEHGTYDSPLVAHYSSADAGAYFGWRDVGRASPIHLSKVFIERLPEIAAAGWGDDWAYAGWYLEMLRLTRPNRFPYAMADWEMPDDYLPTVSMGSETEVRVPLPPLAGRGSPRRPL